MAGGRSDSVIARMLCGVRYSGGENDSKRRVFSLSGRKDDDMSTPQVRVSTESAQIEFDDQTPVGHW